MTRIDAAGSRVLSGIDDHPRWVGSQLPEGLKDVSSTGRFGIILPADNADQTAQPSSNFLRQKDLYIASGDGLKQVVFADRSHIAQTRRRGQTAAARGFRAF